MFYIYLNPSNNWSISVEPPENVVEYYEFETLPEGEGLIAYENGKLVRYPINNQLNQEIEQPTQLDRIEAQITYTAMMTDTLLEV